MKKKTVLVTGASRGSGRACALTFARAGYHILLNCRASLGLLEETEQEILSLGGTSTKLPADVSNPDAVREMFRAIAAQQAEPDVLVNNAGAAYFGLLTDMSDEDWDHIIGTDLSSVFYCCRAAIPHMVSQKQGKIINISSMWGTSGASCEAAYSAAKAGVHGLTKALAKELAPSNIQVNAVACGAIDTEMNARLSTEERRALEEEIPSGRFGTTQEIADLVLSLAQSPSYLTGQVIGIDGGFL